MAFTYKPYAQTEAEKAAEQRYKATQAAKPGAYNSQYTPQVQQAMNEYLNRKPFQYNLNGDAMYQQYKDAYTRQGKMAMQDTMAQAAAMTGGYGNSYAQTAGQQIYNGYMQQLQDRVPELYNMAMQAYQMRGQEAQNRYNMLNQAEQQEYGRYQDNYQNWQNERNFASQEYQNERNFGYNQYTEERNFAANQEKETYNRQKEEHDTYLKFAQQEVEYLLEQGADIPEWLLKQSEYDPAYIAARRAEVAEKNAQKGRGGGGGAAEGETETGATGGRQTSSLYEVAEMGIGQGYTPQEMVQGFVANGVSESRAEAVVQAATSRNRNNSKQGALLEEDRRKRGG